MMLVLLSRVVVALEADGLNGVFSFSSTYSAIFSLRRFSTLGFSADSNILRLLFILVALNGSL